MAPDLFKLLDLLRVADGQVATPNGTAFGLIWAQEGTSPAVVLNGVTGETYFDGRKIARDFAEAITIFRKRATRIEYGVDPPEDVYNWRKARIRNRKRAAARAAARARARTRPRPETESVKLLAPIATPLQRAAGENPMAPDRGDGNIMDVIRDMVGPRRVG
jgi:hypothetical protein